MRGNIVPRPPILSGTFSESLPLPSRYHVRCNGLNAQYMLTIPSAADDGGFFRVGNDTNGIKMAYYNSAAINVWHSTDVTGILSTATDGGKISYMSDGAYYGVMAGSSTSIALYKLANPYVNSTLTKLAQYTLVGVAATHTRSYGMQETPTGDIKIIYGTDSNNLRSFVVNKTGAVVIADAPYAYAGSNIYCPNTAGGAWYETKDLLLFNPYSQLLIANNRHINCSSIPFVGAYQTIYTHMGHVRFTSNLGGDIVEGNGFVQSEFDTYIYNLASNLGLLRA